jgi:hypothetical protein
MFMRMLALLGGMALMAAVVAADVAIKRDHPDVYVVQKGDTLWGIAGRFLQHPWQWPEIWQANPQVKNPHRIYPGDRLSLVYRDGRPMIAVDGEGRLSPRVREEALGDAITAVPLSEVLPFLRRVMIVGDKDERRMPYVVALEENRINAVEGMVVYVRGIDAAPGTRVSLLRPMMRFWDVPERWPWDSSERRADGVSMIGDPLFNRPEWYWTDTLNWSFRARSAELLGTELLEVAEGEVLRGGDPTTVLVTRGAMEIRKGDRVSTTPVEPFDLTFMPRAPARVPGNFRVMAISGGLRIGGPRGVIALSKGSRDGVENGQVYSVFHPGETINDDIKYPPDQVDRLLAGRHAQVQLPDEYVAKVMVFRTFEKMSYGLIVDGIRPVSPYDRLRAPFEE